MFTEKDLNQIAERGSSEASVREQIQFFEQGFPWMNLEEAATVGRGILRLDDAELAQQVAHYDQLLFGKKIVKFVPASGAASRMFKQLFAFRESFSGSQEEVNQLKAENTPGSMGYFFHQLKNFAFYDDLEAVAQKAGTTLSQALEEGKYAQILDWLLTDQGLGYGQLPKALLKFHRYDTASRTPLEEHISEGAAHCSANGMIHLHFTVSPEHEARFQQLLSEKKAAYEQKFNVKLNISFSYQKPATDTIAVEMDNQPFREKDGSLLFRPGGHGALLENLNDIEADVIFVKNIDNVVPDRLRQDTITYKKALGGLLFAYQSRIFEYARQLGASGAASEETLAELEELYRTSLCTLPPKGFESWDAARKTDYFRQKLNRPLKVCGMVKNEGEPGGGPFLAKNPDGTISLQIVEKAQIDMDNQAQKAIVDQATHFNPVDLVCGVKDWQGNKYDLMSFRDPDTGFIAYKSKNGRELKALEWPGLWNGSMSDWNTLFVEVPITTFNPVKTVFDLLRPSHQ